MKLEKKEITEEEKEIRIEKLKNRIGLWVLISFSIPIFFLIFKIINASGINATEEMLRTKSDYILMLIQCLLGIFALVVPNIILERKKIQIPTNIYILYMVFLYCAIFLGEVRNFYYRIPHWDTILHTFSGIMIGALGFSFVSIFNKSENLHLKLTPFFVAFFSFMFAVTLGVVWEIYEFVFDGLLDLNMQKFYDVTNSVMLCGRNALEDTMNDLIVDMIGAFIVSVIGYISLKYKKGWVEKHLIKYKK